MRAQFSHLSITPGEPLELFVEAIAVGEQIEFQIYSVGGLNREFAMSFGAPVAAAGVVRHALDTSSFRPGYYELISMRVITANGELDPTVHMTWQPRAPHERVLFKVAQSLFSGSAQALLQEVLDTEARVEADFLGPVHAAVGLARPATRRFTTFVFVRGMLIGSRIRFPNFEIAPAGNGLDDTDTLNSINAFFRQKTAVTVNFRYSEQRAQYSRQTNPVCVFYFPYILGTSHGEARTYAEAETDKTLLALALTRDASGVIFDCVVFEDDGQAQTFSRGGNYVGNLLTGWLAGESQQQIATLAEQIGRSSSDRLLVTLYKDARSELTPDFQYVRFWAVLEALADAREYDSDDPLIDFEGQRMFDGTRPLNILGGVNSVFSLMRESGYGSTERNWKLINTWFAFRTAAAHHGSRLNYAQLQRASVKGFAERARVEIMAEGGDQFLWELKEAAKLLLMRRLNRAAPW